MMEGSKKEERKMLAVPDNGLPSIKLGCLAELHSL
jgi:hypothetical protein